MTGPAAVPTPVPVADGKAELSIILTFELLSAPDGSLWATVTEADETVTTPFPLPQQYASMLPMVLGQLRQLKP